MKIVFIQTCGDIKVLGSVEVDFEWYCLINTILVDYSLCENKSRISNDVVKLRLKPKCIKCNKEGLEVKVDVDFHKRLNLKNYVRSRRVYTIDTLCADHNCIANVVIAGVKDEVSHLGEYQIMKFKFKFNEV